MNAYEASLEALTKNIKTAVRRVKKDGTVAIGKRWPARGSSRASQ